VQLIDSRISRLALATVLVAIVAALAAFAAVSSASTTATAPVAAAARHGADDPAGDDRRPSRSADHVPARCRRKAASVSKARRAQVMRRCARAARRAHREREARHGADDPAGDDHGTDG